MSGGEFVKKRNRVSCFDRIEHRLIERIQLLVAAPARAGVENRIAGFALRVGIALIDLAEIGQERNQTPAALVNSVPRAVEAIDLFPRKRLADRGVFEPRRF